MAENARVASERANAFLKNRNNAQAQAAVNQAAQAEKDAAEKRMLDEAQVKAVAVD